MRWVTRAVVREIVPKGEFVECRGCGQELKWNAKRHPLRVIANVYRNGRWVDTEEWHLECYLEAGEPHGEPDRTRTKALLIRDAAKAYASVAKSEDAPV
jgi:hypothetical protein